jgi:hypothetical protein
LTVWRAMMRCICAFSASSCLSRARIARVHTVVLRAPEADGVRVNGVPTGEFFHRRAGIVLGENLDDLRFGEAALYGRLGRKSTVILGSRSRSETIHKSVDGSCRSPTPSRDSASTRHRTR